MAVFNFALECPKCGSINTASNFFFAKKVIKCGTCGEEINVKQSRLISKECPHCGKVFIFDQSKKEAACPHCNRKMQRYDAETVRYQMVTIHCPQCGCGVEANKNNTDYVCPLCKEHINVATEFAKAQLVKNNTISVIKYEGDNDALVWKHPIEDFNMGSQLIVHESQEAIVYINGQANGPYTEGQYTLDTENIPILKTLFDIPTGGPSPFHCEVYYVNKTVHLGMKWGTPDKVRFLEPVSGIPLEIGASGEIAFQVSDGRKLLAKLVGTTCGISNKDILASSESIKVVTNGTEKTTVTKTLQSFFRAPLVTGVKSYLAQTIKEQQLNILEIDSKLDELSDALRDKISPRFEEYGLTIPDFYVTTVVLPEDDKNFRDMKALISAAWLKVREAEVSANITAAQRQVELEKKTTELEKLKLDAEMRRIQAQADADAERMKGITDAEIMAAKGYNQKDVLTADVQKAYAAGIGNMGSNGGGSAGGSMVAEIVGMVAGMKAVGNVTDQLGNIIPSSEKQQAPVAVSEGWKCSCGHESNKGKFCEFCGKEKIEPWTCECGHAGNLNKFCGECGKPRPEAWTCTCGYSGNKGKFCEACGSPKANNTGWNCSCGHEGNTGAFCSECGSPKA